MSKKADKIIEDVVEVLPREIRGVTQWALRAARIPAGYSPAAEQMVANSEISTAVGLTCLKDFVLSDPASPVRVHLVSDTGKVAQIDGLNQHVLICAPSVFDFAFARSRKNGRYFLTVRNVIGGFELLPELAAYNASRGVGCCVLWSDGRQSGSIIALPSKGASFETPTEPDLFCTVAAPSEAHQQLFGLRVDGDIPAFDDLLAVLFQEPSDTELSSDLQKSFSICCFSMADSLLWERVLLDSEAMYDHMRPDMRKQRWDEAEQNGVSIAGELWYRMKEYGSQILIAKEA